MEKLIEIKSTSDIPSEYKGTPIADLLEYHNLDKEYREYTQAELLIGMCMDHREHLSIPGNFSYIIRTGGANLKFSEFKVSFAIAVGGVRHIALIGHNNCGMVNLKSKQKKFIDGMVDNAGWDAEIAEEHFKRFEPIFEIENEIEFLKSEAIRLRMRYPKIVFAPMLFKVENSKIYLIKEN
ncbi:MAG: carbonic anhydrase [Ignavibacteriae bacterium]|jgi:carbonic anhydrase|nr:carbonic anhydrase [Ignavibacteriota bacterium]NOG99589.1 carbonic anhydrase [Ignavibacteriota bacterium]